MLSRRQLLGGIATLPALSNQVGAKVARGESSGLGPIVASTNGRYFVNQATGLPWLMVADLGQGMAIMSPPDVQHYLATRARQGFNAIQWDIIVTGLCNPDRTNYTTLDGIAPFTGAKIKTPNPAYFSRMDLFVQFCAQNNLVAILNPYETAAGLHDLVAAGHSACFTFGAYLGNRYKLASNVMWLGGNDYQQTGNANGDAVVLNLLLGIASVAPSQLRSIELNYNQSTGRDNSTLNPALTATGAYTYSAAFIECLAAYNPPATKFADLFGTNASSATFYPGFLIETVYEFTHWSSHPPGPSDDGATINIRRQSYWAMLGGMGGQIYGNAIVWGFSTTMAEFREFNPPGIVTLVGPYSSKTPLWKNNLETPGATCVGIWAAFFQSIPWWNLIPDQTHVIGTAGYGNPGTSTTYPFAACTYVALSATADGHCAVAYFSLGSASTLTVALGGFAGTVTAQWFDPTNGAYTSIGTFSNSGSHKFTPMGKNNAGDPDWVLLLRV